MDDKLAKMSKETVVPCFKVLSWNSPRGIKGNERKTSVRIIGVPAEIRTKHILNTSLQRYLLIQFLHISNLQNYWVLLICKRTQAYEQENTQVHPKNPRILVQYRLICKAADRKFTCPQFSPSQTTHSPPTSMNHSNPISWRGFSSRHHFTNMLLSFAQSADKLLIRE
jgi:hypothetical protein